MHATVQTASTSVAPARPLSVTDHFPPLPRRTEGTTSRLGLAGASAKVAGPPSAVLLNPAVASQPQKSFLDVAVGSSVHGPRIAPKQTTVHKGARAIHFTVEEIDKLAEPFKFSLVGKFSRGRPPM